MSLDQPWRETTFVALDTETTGAFPIRWEVCELAAVKWRGGEIVDKFESLIRPHGDMDPVAASIHGISMEELSTQPEMEEKLPQFLDFIKDTTIMAHHAPFDLGFLAYDMERFDLKLPEQPIICTSLLSRRVFPNSPNHKLQTLANFLELEKGQAHQAHRALSDADVCLQLGIRCFEELGDVKLADIIKKQAKNLAWKNYSVNKLKDNEAHAILVEATRERRSVSMVYNRGSKPGSTREVLPQGIVRNPDGDYLSALSPGEEKNKRYYLEFISEAEIKL